MLIAHISDLHVIETPPGGLIRPDATQRARALIADIMAFRPGIDLVVITGDNVNDGRTGEYRLLSELLAELTIPVVVTPGNHDDRFGFRATLPGLPYADPTGLWHAREMDGARVLALDTLSPGEVGGRLGAKQLDWLSDTLARPFAGRTFVALHHPPAAPGMGALDRNVLVEGADALRDMLDALPQPAVLLCGHMHRPFALLWGRHMVCAAASTAFQFALELGAAEEPRACDEPYFYEIHAVSRDGAHAIHRRFPVL